MTRLKLAIQKKGRLSDKSLRLLESCGIRIHNGGKLKANSSNFPMDILFLRDDDIPQYVADGVADIGIVGENVFLEKEKPVHIISRLGFGRCRLSIAVQREVDFEHLEWLNDKRVATSYPNILRRFFKENGIHATIEQISGSVEIAPGIGLADAVCDIVSTGSTLLTNGLKEVNVVMKSEAVLISRSDTNHEIKALIEDLLFRINAVQSARRNKYILLNAPNDKLEQISAILPGMKSPTILPLAEPGWSSLHSVIQEDAFWESIEELKAAGAEGILVCPIEKMII